MVRIMAEMLVVLVLATAVSSCSSDGDPYDSPSGPSSQPIPPGPTTVLIPVGAAVQTGPGFAPVTLTVPVGTTVTWGNNDSAQHTASSDGAGWNLILNSGATGSFRFSTAGTFPYHCDLHASMRGTVIVQ